MSDVILPAVLDAKPDQTIMVGDFDDFALAFLTLNVPALAHNTNDALVKRDVAALACTSEWIAYFSDDHKPAPDFGDGMRWLLNVSESGSVRYDVFVPARYASQPGHEGERVNNGEAIEELPLPGQWRDQAIGHYCGGHAGVYRKSLIERFPWSAGPHHREWDLLNSRRHMDGGARYCWTDALKVFDVEPNGTPWT